MACIGVAKIKSTVKSNRYYIVAVSIGNEIECLRESENQYSEHAVLTREKVNLKLKNI